jgi:hypothetical protein
LSDEEADRTLRYRSQQRPAVGHLGQVTLDEIELEHLLA